MGRLGIWELIIIVVLVLVIFGGRKLPELGRGLGRGLANFRQAVKEPGRPGEDRSDSGETDAPGGGGGVS